MTDTVNRLYHFEPARLDTRYGRHYETAAGIFPGVTTILSATKDRTGLEAWEQRIGPEKAESIRQDACERGTWVHSAIEGWLEFHQEPEYSWSWMPWWNSVRQFLPRVKSPLIMEGAVSHPHYQYAGTIDLLAITDDNHTTLIDWKTSGSRKKPEYLEDYLLQLGAYTHAIEATYKGQGVLVDRGILVIALPDEPPQIVEYERSDLDNAFETFKHRINLYWENRLGQGANNQ